MELTQLIQFREIAKCETISQAAEHLHVSQPALSTMLKKLEAELGVQLFDRTRNRMTINDAGRLALSHAEQIIRQVDGMKEEMAEYSRRDHLFKVAFCDPGPMWYSTPRFSMLYPELELKTSIYHPEDVNEEEMLREGKVDLLVTATELTHLSNELVSKTFLQEQLLLSVKSTHPAAVLTEVSLREAPITELARYHVDGTYARRQQPLFDEVGKRVHIHWYEDYFLFRQMIQNSGIPTSTTKIVRHYRDDGSDRCLIPITDPEAQIVYQMMYLRKNEKRIKPLLNWLEVCMADYNDKKGASI